MYGVEYVDFIYGVFVSKNLKRPLVNYISPLKLKIYFTRVHSICFQCQFGYEFTYEYETVT